MVKSQTLSSCNLTLRCGRKSRIRYIEMNYSVPIQALKVMPGAKQLIAELKEAGIFVAIVSAGVDLFVSSIASMLKVDDWIANGFEFNR